jgi:hypothetical protein
MLIVGGAGLCACHYRYQGDVEKVGLLGCRVNENSPPECIQGITAYDQLREAVEYRLARMQPDR